MTDMLHSPIEDSSRVVVPLPAPAPGQKSASRSAARQVRLLPCEIGGVRYCLDHEPLISIERGYMLRRNSSAVGPTGWLAQPDEIPVYSLSRLLGQSERVDGQVGRVLLMETQHGRWGLLAEHVDRGFEVDPGTILAVPAPARTSSSLPFRGAVLSDDRLTLVLEPARLHPAGRHDEPVLTTTSEAETLADRIPGLASTAASRGRMVMFATGSAWLDDAPLSFGLSLAQVLEVAPMPRLTAVPGAPEHVLGLVPWHGLAVPVVDLDLRLGGLFSSLRTDRRLLVARARRSGHLLAFPVHKDVRVLRLPFEHRPTALPQLLDEAYCRGAFRVRQGVLVMLDLPALYGAGPRPEG